jgi:DNA-binding FrmR family transcriptional regulator
VKSLKLIPRICIFLNIRSKKYLENISLDFKYPYGVYYIQRSDGDVCHEDLPLDSGKEPVKPRTDSEKRAVINRLKRIEGQVRGLQKMIEEDRYCVDTLIQISAVTKALNKVGYSLLERHTHHCVASAIQQGEGDEAIDELMKVVQQFSK